MSYVNYGRAAHEAGLRTTFETSAPKDTWAEDWTKPVTDAGSKPRHSLEDSKCTAAGLSPYMDMQMFMARQASDGEKMLQRLAPGSMDARPQISTNSISSPSNLVGQPTVQAPTPVQAQADKPPPGCAADAIKLFVGNIPKSCTESQLLPFFETIGKVVDLVILRDKITHASKGSAFLWYATRMQAEMAILQFNLRHTLPDPTGEHVRPVVLRKAKCTTKNPVQGAASDVGQARPAESISSLLSQTYSSRSMMPQGFSSGPQAVGQMTVPRCGSQQVELEVMDSLAQAWGRLQMGTQTQGRRDGYDSYPQDLMGTYLGKGSGQYMEPQPEPEVMTVAIALNRQQLSAVNDCMHDVQVISGAQLSINPRGTTGLFQLCITGIQRQVKAAQNLVETIFR